MFGNSQIREKLLKKMWQEIPSLSEKLGFSASRVFAFDPLYLENGEYVVTGTRKLVDLVVKVHVILLC